MAATAPLVGAVMWVHGSAPQCEVEERGLHQVAWHQVGCLCHPVALECCYRSRPRTPLSRKAVDALDDNDYAWHVDPRCTPLPRATNRVVVGHRVEVSYSCRNHPCRGGGEQ